MRLFRHRPSVGIGVDFGTSSVKVVELVRGRSGFRLVTYAVTRQPNLLLDNNAPDSVPRAAVLLRAMFQRAHVSHGEVAAALPVLSVFSTVLELPQMPERELSSAVTFMAKNYVPSPLTEVVLGWLTIGPPEDLNRSAPAESAPVGEGQGSSSFARLGTGAAAAPRPVAGAPLSPTRSLEIRKIQEVFLTAAPRELVGRYTALFERLNLRLAALEVESFPLARSLIRGDRRPILLVDLGDRTTSFSIVERGYLRLNQAIDVGGEAITNAIAKKLSLPIDQAEQRKRAEGLSSSAEAGAAGTSDIGSSIAAILRPLVMEIITRAEVVRRLYERKSHRALAAVQLIGGGARLPQLAAFWTSVTGVPCEVGNPWRGISVPAPLTEHLRRLGPSFSVAVGLALRPFEES
ncbi:MAG: type IV pilus assembly protein PilM [Parcubacteria group bacterium Gr01-1014_38]|nr:MAG: type IV pilus assembly protein PilM [Parcubacteria group bacterium Gr01-1014_38]